MRRGRTRVSAAILCLLGALTAASGNLAAASVVTLAVKNTSGASPEDTLVIFDPLDATPLLTRNSAVIDQVDKKFVPRVSVIRKGTAVTFPNSDRIRHQVYSFSKAKPFTLKLYAGSPQVAVDFDQAGLVVLGCNIHDTMVAFVGVVASPYFTKITQSGIAAVDLPPGRYRMRVWNPGMTAAFTPVQITVGKDSMPLSVSVDVDPKRNTGAAWPE